jgi:hypothetical protein
MRVGCLRIATDDLVTTLDEIISGYKKKWRV